MAQSFHDDTMAMLTMIDPYEEAEVQEEAVAAADRHHDHLPHRCCVIFVKNLWRQRVFYVPVIVSFVKVSTLLVIDEQ